MSMLYGPVPPVIATLIGVSFPSQIEALPLNAASVGLELTTIFADPVKLTALQPEAPITLTKV